MTRYELLPLRRWEILAAKDIAFLGMLLVLTAPLDAAAGLAFGLAALAIGRYPAVRVHLPQRRWRFSSGRVLFGVLQGVVGARRMTSPLCWTIALGTAHSSPNRGCSRM